MRIQIVSIGDELLIGQTVNTNAAWMGEHLTLDGWVVGGVEVVSDCAIRHLRRVGPWACIE
jgi:nicotinamide-nucleotide amidase